MPEVDGKHKRIEVKWSQSADDHYFSLETLLMTFFLLHKIEFRNPLLRVLVCFPTM